jgi:hypothetical protein
MLNICRIILFWFIAGIIVSSSFVARKVMLSVLEMSKRIDGKMMSLPAYPTYYGVNKTVP